VSLFDRAVTLTLPFVPRRVVRVFAGRYIAGAGLDDAVGVVRALNRAGKLATIDVLGEEIRSAEEARSIGRAYHEVFARIARHRLKSNVSIKLTALGLKLGYELCRDNVEALVADAASRSNFVRIDMEDSSCTDDTLRLYRDLRAAGHDNLGIVLQASLRRTVGDVEELVQLRPNVRLCKGIYVEAASIQHHDDDEVRASFVEALRALLDAGCYVGVATHDELLIERSLELVEEHRLEPDAYELQMLLGVREDRAGELVAAGHRLRVYVPFGSHWYEYSLRRLQENPKLAGYVAYDVLDRVLPKRR
jgi:proline dehydrogenase